MNHHRFFVIALSAMLIASCQKDNVATEPSDTISFMTISGQKIFSLEDTAQAFDRDCDISISDSAVILMPEVLYGFDVKPLRDTIMSLAFDTICSNPAQAMTEYFTAAANELGYTAVEMPIDSVCDDVDIDGYFVVKGYISNLTDRMLTYRIDRQNYYPGAAHGMQNVRYVTYDLLKGGILTLSDIFTHDGIERLPSLISRRAAKLVAQLGPTDITSLPVQGDFYISIDDQIVFVYQPYEVASYAQGIIQVPFYPYELSEYLTPEALAFFDLDQ